MIRHFVEAVGDENPVYTDEKAAHAAGFPGVIAPPPMLQAWIMRGYQASMDPKRTGAARPIRRGDERSRLGRLHVCRGDRLRAGVHAPARSRRQDSRRHLSSSRSRTGRRPHLGDGHFFTTRLEFMDAVRRAARHNAVSHPQVQAGRNTAAQAEQRSQLLKPQLSRRGPDDPMPAITHDNSFFFEGAARGELLIQRCESCGTLSHPPRPGCP